MNVRSAGSRARAKAKRRLWHIALAAAALAAMATGLSGLALGHEGHDDHEPHAAVIDLDGIIHPISAAFLSRALEKAARDGAAVVVVQLDTPGGLLDSTRDMVEELFASPVPVAVYVAPAGSRAASAGTFITAAANFGAMAPGTNIGAASPISGSGEEISETLESKIFQDTAAFMRSIAERRGRNVEALEATVLKAISYSASEAVEMQVVDLLAEDLNDLLEQLDGRTTTVPTESGSETVTMRTSGLETRTIGMGFFDTILSFIADPNIAFLLLSLGGFAIIIELLNFGLIVPGVFGAIALVLAFMALGNLPVNWAGVALILLAIVLTVLELNVAGYGALGVGAWISFVVGGILLFSHFGTPSPTLPSIRVSLWLLVPMAAVAAVFGGGFIRTVIQSRHAPAPPDLYSLIGAIGKSTTALAPEGTVWVHGVLWSARLQGEDAIGSDEQVRVVAEDGATLTVERHQEEGETEPTPGQEESSEEQTEE